MVSGLHDGVEVFYIRLAVNDEAARKESPLGIVGDIRIPVITLCLEVELERWVVLLYQSEQGERWFPPPAACSVLAVVSSCC